MAHRDTVKPWFETNDYPTQAQFYSLFDKLRFLDDTITINEIADLVDALLAKADLILVRPEELTLTADGEFLMPEKYKLNNVFIKNNTAGAMTITLATGTNELAVIELGANGEIDTDIGKTFFSEDTVFVTGVEGSITLLIDRK